MAKSSVLVTGASGFIGNHLVDRLLADDAVVTALVRPESSLPERWRGRVDTIQCDDWSEQGLRRTLASFACDTVFHLAAYGVRPTHRDVDSMIRINTELPATLVRLCQLWNARLVMSGTFSEYMKPASNELLMELSPLEAHKLYGSSKAAGGLIASAVATALGVGLRSLRLFKVYGAGEASHRLLPALVHGLKQRQRVPISSGTQILDFVYIDDVIEALLRADDHIRDHGTVATWNVATGQGHSVSHFAQLVADTMNAGHDLLGFGEIAMRKDDEPWLVGDPGLMQSQLGWHPGIDLETGVAASVAAITGRAG
ncbi:NAD(P)-dependent oxidoreductase [Bradyrhizobium prioriisuperbiae]|uniref:NAD-dependent epimerase/dehydratase family protein n=1 Tax=Bradyrhizobium prioriisuperbiae TaxID=2854389 RepID=UPI0028EB3615|nr:NAD(P)-dependent oxidoreductase [Bradyrhizobium prioritasuperba]